MLVERARALSGDEVASAITDAGAGVSGAVPATVFLATSIPRLRRIEIIDSAALRAGSAERPLSKERPESLPRSSNGPPEMPRWRTVRLRSKYDSS